MKKIQLTLALALVAIPVLICAAGCSDTAGTKAPPVKPGDSTLKQDTKSGNAVGGPSEARVD